VTNRETKQAAYTACSECGGPVRIRIIRQKFEREGTRVSVAGIRALVCARCGEIYFPSGAAQALIEAANGLFALDRRNRQSSGRLAAKVRSEPSLCGPRSANIPPMCYDSAMSAKLTAANPFLREPAVRERTVLKSVVTSSAIEGIHAPFSPAQKNGGKQRSSKAAVRKRRASV